MSVPRVSYESRGVAEVEICGANPDLERLSELIAKWLCYWLSQLVVIVLIPKVCCKHIMKAVEEAKDLGALEEAKARERAKPLRVVLYLFAVGTAAWVAYEIAQANE